MPREVRQILGPRAWRNLFSRFGPGFPDALRHARPRDQRSDQHRDRLREKAASSARDHAAIDQRPLRDPASVDDYRVEARGTLPNDATLLSFFLTCICAENNLTITLSAPMAASNSSSREL